jgi:plastocyanin
MPLPPTESEPSPTATTSPEAGSPAPAETVEVRLADSDFDPAELTIAAGTEVVFVNGDDYGHTITEGRDGRAAEDPFVDEELEQEPVSVTFDEPGTFELTCRIHPTMNMTITVEG